YALAKAYLEADGVIWSGNRLEHFDRVREGARRYRLIIRNQQSGSTWTVNTDRVVLAMPRRSLELLAGRQSSSFCDAEKLNSVISRAAFKLLMGFEKPWWRDNFGATAGESITDLPIRQCYYFGTDSKTGHSLFLSSYNDMQTVSFWETLE